MTFEIRPDDLSADETQRLIARHLDDMRGISPEESCHALDLAGLRHPSIRFWSAWEGDRLAGIGALKALDDRRGEIKSMRVDDAFLGRGVGRSLLRHIVEAARESGMTSLWLETGSTAEFAPALRLYETEGFSRCGPFDDYVLDPFSVFLTRAL